MPWTRIGWRSTRTGAGAFCGGRAQAPSRAPATTSVLKTVGSVEGGNEIREKAERISDGLGGEWEALSALRKRDDDNNDDGGVGTG